MHCQPSFQVVSGHIARIVVARSSDEEDCAGLKQPILERIVVAGCSRSTTADFLSLPARDRRIFDKQCEEVQ